ncbi:shikimate dehydrogenase [Methylomagnum sp.]
MPDRYAVFGHPISHSKSPHIHTLFAAQTGQDLVYTAQDVPAESFETSVRAFFAAGGRGLNCTVPLKELAFRFADQLSERATRAKAVNTLALLPGGEILGDNTDGVGLVRDLTVNLGLSLKGRRILLLGAGGASRGILSPLLEHQPDCLVIANRTPEKAAQLAAEFANLGPVTGGGFGNLAGKSFDLILNATAASLSGDLPDLPAGVLAEGGSGYDLAYGKEPTPFARWGQAAGTVLSVDGIGMLVEQAAEAFLLWRGVRPETHPVIAALEAERREL